MTDPAPATSWSSRRLLACVLAYTTLLFLLRLTGPSNLTDNDQERPASYILDALVNGHWMVQYDWTGDITSKPPAYTWLAGLAARLFGGLNLFTLYLPCALAMFGAATCVTLTAGKAIHPRVGALAGLFLLANPLSAKLVALARTDPLFTFAVALTASLAFRAWNQGRGWTAAWLAAAFATLTKGPLGLVLGFSGLLAWFWERKSGARSPWNRGHARGFALWILLCGGWFFLAWLQAGQPLVRKMLGAELVQHALATQGTLPGSGLVLTPAYYLSRFLPWSVLSLVGLWMAFRHPENLPGARRLQRFAAAWLTTGWIVFGLAGHQRGDLIAPLMPAGALLAAIPVARWTAFLTERSLAWIAATVALVIALGAQAQFATRTLDVFALDRALASVPAQFARSGENPALLRHVDTPFALQFHFGTMHRTLSVEQAAEHLRLGFDHTVAVSDLKALEQQLGDDAVRLQTLLTVPQTEPFQVRIVALRPPLHP